MPTNAAPEAPAPATDPSVSGPTGAAFEAALWLLLAAAVIGLGSLNHLALRSLPAQEPAPGERLDLVLQAQYAVGVADLLRRAPALGVAADGQDDPAAAARASLGPRLARLARGPRERIAVALVRAETGEADRALRELASLMADESLEPSVRAEARTFRRLYAPSAPSDPASRRELLGDDLAERYGWFAELAAGGGDNDPLRRARRVAVGLAVAVAVVLLLFVAGLVIDVVLLSRAGRRAGPLGDPRRSGYRALVEPGADHDGGDPTTDPAGDASFRAAARLPYLETLLVFLAAVTLVGGASALLVEQSGSTWGLLLNWAVLPVLLWPLLRGRRRGELRRALGWTAGRGWWREAAAGLVGYVAAMPVLGCGLLLSLVFQRFVEAPPHHPIVDWVGDAGPGGLLVVFVLAAVWAPLIEESVFRGAFYHYLRSRLGVVSAALVVALVFAAIHPQGLAGLPFLAALAFSLALIREWRGSVLASVTVHAVHNGLATLLLVTILG